MAPGHFTEDFLLKFFFAKGDGTLRKSQKNAKSAFFRPLSADFDWIFVEMPLGMSWGHFETIGAGFEGDPTELW